MKKYLNSRSIRSNCKGLNISFPFLPFFTFFLLLFASLFVFTIQDGHCAQVALSWDSNSEPDLAGYNIYYGTSSRNYQWAIDVGNITTYTLNDLDFEGNYYITATAYNTQGLESGFSNEVVYAVPSCSYTLSSSSDSFPAFGGKGSVAVTTQAGCNWGTSAAPSWVTLISGSGTGSGMMSYTVSPNTGTTERVSSLTVAGNVFTMTEAGAGKGGIKFILPIADNGEYKDSVSEKLVKASFVAGTQLPANPPSGTNSFSAMKGLMKVSSVPNKAYNSNGLSETESYKFQRIQATSYEDPIGTRSAGNSRRSGVLSVNRTDSTFNTTVHYPAGTTTGPDGTFITQTEEKADLNWSKNRGGEVAVRTINGITYVYSVGLSDLPNRD